ncbi:MAG: hypothetical protein EOP00_11705 [Pedobacter sp.]|nr:MAG: hypothetical protein EOP00_11705 [Pedobacter sp.]
MLDTYFFIPGDKEKFINKIDSLDADYIVIDLEDAVSLQNKEGAFELTMSVVPQKNHFVRIPFFDKCYSEELLIKLLQHFEGRIVVPKLREQSELKQISELLPQLDLRMIILVENPICFINLPDILKVYSSHIQGVGFGSHDFCSITGIKHTLENLSHYKRQLVLYTKAFNVDYIDGVDLDLKDFTQFKNECVFAFEIGSNGKFLIHPSQIEVLKNVKFITDAEMEQLKAVYEKVKNIPEDSIEVYTINEKVYEKPHIIRIKYLMEKLQKKY